MWHAFTAHYNTYFNGEQAFIEGEKAKESGHKDNYTEFLPVFLVGNEKSRSLGKTNYETAITKSQKAVSLHSIKRRPKAKPGKNQSAKTKAYMQRKEYNPFLKNAWMLMGKAQFEKGEFFEAASTFSYITRLYAAEPLVASEARGWLARCYSQTEWFYDAEDALARLGRDSVNSRTRKEMDATRADLLLRQQRFADAVPYLTRAARSAKGSFRQARLYFLLGQVHKHLGNKQEAYKAFGKCIKKSPPYEMSFNARILQTEVMADRGEKGKKMIARLRRMARSSTNKEYLDQVYYAIGNIHLLSSDTLAAIAAYETGREKGKRNGVEKGVLLLRLGSLYWDKRKFDEAQKCYTEALGLIDKTRDDYAELSRRSKILDKLVPYTSAVYLQDSLQSLARMSEKDRNAAIDRVIEALKKKEAEERKARRDSAAQARRGEGGTDDGENNRNNANTGQTNTAGNQSKEWYFYNTLVVNQGKQDFIRRWGKRANEDNWRRSNRTVVSMEGDEGFDYAADDSLRAVEDSLANISESETEMEEKADSAANDPHKREYYLAQIPFTEEAKAASNDIIKDGLYNAGIIEKDDLEDFPLAESTLRRLTDEYTDYEKMPSAYYHLFLLYLRTGNKAKADEMRRILAAQYPDDEMGRIINRPDYEYQARYGRAIEDSLYTSAYQAYRKRQNAEVERLFNVSTEKYPSGLNRPKFIFVHALSRLSTASTKEITAELRELLTKYPESDVSPMAGMIVKGLESGRAISSGTFDIGSLWNRRTAASDSVASDAARAREFSSEEQTDYLFVLAYPTDSVDAKALLYEMAHFNFATFVVRGFDMNFVHDNGLSKFIVSGFNSYDEAHAYAQRVAASADLRPYLEKGKTLVISKANLDLIGTTFSINDYNDYYDKTFAPKEIKDNLIIEQGAPVRQHYEDEYTDDELERMNSSESEESGGDDDGEWY